MNKNSFYFGADVGDYLIKGIYINSVGGLIGVCVFVGALAFLFEFLRYLQAKQKQKELIIRAKQIKQLCPTESATLLAKTITNPKNPLNITLFDRFLLFGTEVTLWMTLQNLGYIIMLTVMLYDAWLLISTVLGGSIGYFVFGQKFMKINLENCHIIRDTYCTQICGETDVEAFGKPGESTPVLEVPSTSTLGNTFQCHRRQSSPTQRSHVINVVVDCHT